MSLQLPIDKIDIRDQYQIRFHLDETRVNEYAELMKDGVQFPPILVGEFVGYRGPDPDPTYFLLDGFHRLEAAKRAGKTAMIVNVAQVHSQSDKIETALRANSQHGLPLTTEERRRAVAFLIQLNPGETLQKLARRCGVSKSTVARIRDELSQMGKLDLNGTTTGEDGKQRKQKYDKRKEPEPTSEPEPEEENNMAKCERCGKTTDFNFAMDFNKSGWRSDAYFEKWLCPDCKKKQDAELRAGSGPEDDEPETDMEGGNEAEGEITREPAPEPEPDQETAPKTVRCAVCGREATLEAATFHASSWIYDADSFDSEKMTWTRWFCSPGCEDRWNVEHSNKAAWETVKHVHGKEIAEILYGLYERVGYVSEDPKRATQVLDHAWCIYIMKIDGKEYQ